MKIFVTGGIGSGKSTFSQYMEQKGAYVIYADRVGHENLKKPKMVEKLIKTFGSDIVDDEGNINRSILAKKAFKNAESTKKLDSITQSYLYQECLRQIYSAEKKYSVVVLEMAILDGRDDFYKNADCVVCIIASAKVRIDRLVHDRGLSFKDATNRIERQVPDKQREAIADVIFVNNGSTQEFEKEIDLWIKKMKLFF